MFAGWLAFAALGTALAAPIVSDERGYGQLDISGMGQKITMTYAGFDHVITYNFVTKRFNAFDMRRHMTANNTCDYLVFPPLINNAAQVDTFTSMSDLSGTRDAVHMTFLGKENFMLQNTATGEYEIMRCSGFMPQQKQLPCEVYNIGCNKAMKGDARFFYAGVNNRVIRYDPSDGSFDLFSYDSDIPGGAFPFKESMSAQFAPFTGEVEFATLMLPSGKELLLALHIATGDFKVWEYSSHSRKIDGLIKNMVISGNLEIGYRVKHIGENSLMIFHESSGEFEVLQFDSVDGNVTIASQKRDSLFYGHPCIHHTRGACVSSPGCGWCSDSARCYQLDNLRRPCNGDPCTDIVDEYSSPKDKFKTAEDGQFIFPEWGDESDESPVSPVRGAGTRSSAVPLETPHADIDMEENKKVNPEQGTVFIPPPPDSEHKMDDRYVPAALQKWPEIEESETKMNNAVAVREVQTHSALRDAAKQQPKTVEELEPPVPATVNVSLIAPCDRGPDKSLLKPEEYTPPAVTAKPSVPKFDPAETATQSGEDMMNSILSKYSALAPKTMNTKAERDVEETAFVPRNSKYQENPTLAYNPPKPTQTLPKPPVQREEAVTPVVLDAYSSEQMEFGSPAKTFDGPVHSPQGMAMVNAQYKSESIYKPWVPNPEVTSLEHKYDLAGRHSIVTNPDMLLKEYVDTYRSSDHQGFVEGHAFEDKSVEAVSGKDAKMVLDDTEKQDEVDINGCCIYPSSNEVMPITSTTLKPKSTTKYSFIDTVAANCQGEGDVFKPGTPCRKAILAYESSGPSDVPAV